MLVQDPSKRIGTAEVWSVIDSLKDRIIKINQYETNISKSSAFMSKSASVQVFSPQDMIQEKFTSFPAAKPPIVP